jgi:hypothetical protein
VSALWIFLVLALLLAALPSCAVASGIVKVSAWLGALVILLLVVLALFVWQSLRRRH